MALEKWRGGRLELGCAGAGMWLPLCPRILCTHILELCHICHPLIMPPLSLWVWVHSPDLRCDQANKPRATCYGSVDIWPQIENCSLSPFCCLERKLGYIRDSPLPGFSGDTKTIQVGTVLTLGWLAWETSGLLLSLISSSLLSWTGKIKDRSPCWTDLELHLWSRGSSWD
jgi:hypothetical protein